MCLPNDPRLQTVMKYYHRLDKTLNAIVLISAFEEEGDISFTNLSLTYHFWQQNLRKT